ncbi:MAG: heme exporter protein CcmD [Pseudomonadales bacterium]|nr:heme exporter protein CcmD [Pseudomonadales bacterium]
MRFESLQAFLTMDGHGIYVWLAYGITLLVLTANLWWPRYVRDGFIRSEKRFRQAIDRETGEGS